MAFDNNYFSASIKHDFLDQYSSITFNSTGLMNFDSVYNINLHCGNVFEVKSPAIQLNGVSTDLEGQQTVCYTAFGTSGFQSQVLLLSEDLGTVIEQQAIYDFNSTQPGIGVTVPFSFFDIDNADIGILIHCNNDNQYLGFGSRYAADVKLNRDAAGILAQRNGLNPQSFSIYNTYSDSNNYERAKLSWDSNSFKIGTEKLGGALARPLEIQTDGVTRAYFSTTGNIGIGTNSPDEKLQVSGGKTKLAASTTSKASLNVPSGTAPTSPENGDIWFDGTNLKIRINGVTRTINVT